ncbi:HNH endonuclease [Acinetobacter lwoffii]|uniref:HNH endonuclease n=1 Tax=Acinetobacter lwoffii TaxID=28090 RepID=UPI00209BB665|nr:HNH endonuclease [Acinetobacter lwoffii]MCO8095370.1 HNH endonuclease [Acinetobacter lwoffii]
MNSRLSIDAIKDLVSKTGIDLNIKASAHDGIFGVKCWFKDFSLREGPIFILRAEGLYRHSLEVRFGALAQPIIDQIKRASKTQIERSADFLKLIEKRDFSIEYSLLNVESFSKLTSGFSVFKATKLKVSDHLSEQIFCESFEKVVTPAIYALAELIGYEELESDADHLDGEMEGALTLKLVKQRERSRRNRYLCLEYQGAICGICRFNPKIIYGEAGDIIEVHHKQPVSLLTAEKVFDPKTDLIPLCPNCHRAVHTKRPIPWTPEELRQILEVKYGD